MAWRSVTHTVTYRELQVSYPTNSLMAQFALHYDFCMSEMFTMDDHCQPFSILLFDPNNVYVLQLKKVEHLNIYYCTNLHMALFYFVLYFIKGKISIWIQCHEIDTLLVTLLVTLWFAYFLFIPAFNAHKKKSCMLKKAIMLTINARNVDLAS